MVSSPKLHNIASPFSELMHATCIAAGGKGLLILGDSGAGKSALAAELICRGAQLVADDQTLLTREGDAIWASCPPNILGKMELRGLGIVQLPEGKVSPKVPVRLAVRLQAEWPERLPDQVAQIPVSGGTVPCVTARLQDPFLAAKLLILLDSDASIPALEPIRLASPLESA